MFFFFNDPATTEIYTLSLTTLFRSPTRESHLVDAQPREDPHEALELLEREDRGAGQPRSEEHTSELQSLTNLVCRLLLEKKKKKSKKRLQARTKHKNTD